MANEHTVGINAYEKLKTFTYLGSLLTNHKEIKAGNSCYYSVQTLLNSGILRIGKLKYIKNNIVSSAI